MPAATSIDGNWQTEAATTAGIGAEHGCLPRWGGPGVREGRGVGARRMTLAAGARLHSRLVCQLHQEPRVV